MSSRKNVSVPVKIRNVKSYSKKKLIDEVEKCDYNRMRVVDLRPFAKKLGIEKIGKLKKNDIIEKIVDKKRKENRKYAIEKFFKPRN